MEQLIVKHYYSDKRCEFISDIVFDIFVDYKWLYETLTFYYNEIAEKNDLIFDESNILVYRCGSVTTLGEFRIYSNPLPIYLEDIKEMLNND